MRGLTFEGIETVVYHEDLAEPEVQDSGDVLVSILRAGICGSDLHQFHGRERVGAGTIPGHEFVGDIVAVGSEVSRLHVGDRVFSPFTTCCGHCFFCQHGLSARCDSWQFFGYQAPAGEDDGGRGLQGDSSRVDSCSSRRHHTRQTAHNPVRRRGHVAGR